MEYPMSTFALMTLEDNEELNFRISPLGHIMLNLVVLIRANSVKTCKTK